ncbi:hypothetical protein L1987_20087 [Smallanthus sonchifolius]|uniref:Uncharacterized protein n=1 Tax=Smallanthus sonchifolius TaxID=185202 RepID=A0ACB9IQV2_9ASTR|nr:hypothetical protein L1987_20087 [Smallanthus sonchifolius]
MIKMAHLSFSSLHNVYACFEKSSKHAEFYSVVDFIADDKPIIITQLMINNTFDLNDLDGVYEYSERRFENLRNYGNTLKLPPLTVKVYSNMKSRASTGVDVPLFDHMVNPEIAVQLPATPVPTPSNSDSSGDSEAGSDSEDNDNVSSHSANSHEAEIPRGGGSEFFLSRSRTDLLSYVLMQENFIKDLIIEKEVIHASV